MPAPKLITPFTHKQYGILFEVNAKRECTATFPTGRRVQLGTVRKTRVRPDKALFNKDGLYYFTLTEKDGIVVGEEFFNQ